MTKNLNLNTTYRAILDAARARKFISYGDIAKANELSWNEARFKMNHHLGRLVKIAADRGWPMPSAIVVNQGDWETGRLEGSARDGFIAAAKEVGIDVSDPAALVEEQQNAIFEWAPNAPDELGVSEELDSSQVTVWIENFSGYL